LVDDVFLTLVILKTADVAESTETVVCFSPSTYKLTEFVLPEVKPVPANVNVRALEAESYPYVSDVTEATGATKLILQRPDGQAETASDDPAKTTTTSRFDKGTEGSRVVLRIRQVISVVVAVRMSQ
jgi:hypothetical protein